MAINKSFSMIQDQSKDQELNQSLSIGDVNNILNDEKELCLYKIKVDNPKLKCCCFKLENAIKYYALYHILWNILELIGFFKMLENDQFYMTVC